VDDDLALSLAVCPVRHHNVMRLVLLVITLVLLALAGCSDAPPAIVPTGNAQHILQPKEESTAPLQLAPCQISDVVGSASCGSLSVYENRQLATGRRIELRIVVLRARNEQERQRDPIFLLTGGPGLGVATEAWTVGFLGDARNDHDVVLVDQRGTGGSSPLSCDLYGSGPSAMLGSRFPVGAVQMCRDSLERRADLTQYTTSVAVDDLDDVRTALGYPEIDLVGFSYGAKAALVYLKRHPTHVRRVVVDGVVTTRYATPLPAARAGAHALRRVFDDCAAEPACARIYPSLEADFRHAVDHLARTPAAVTLTSWHGLRRTEVLLTERAFKNGIWVLLYSASGARTVPSLIHRAAEGDFGYAAGLIAENNQARWKRGSVGTLLSIVCSEDVPVIAPSDAKRADAESLLGAPLTDELLVACSGWPRAALPQGYRDPVRSDVPVLLLSGELDPVLPSDYAAEAARSLSHSTHIIRPGAGHVDGDDCTARLLTEFLSMADPAKLNASCATQSRRPHLIATDAIRVSAP
jgi:pimeloyl-ACP methyl ester carboxylesterase